MDLILFLKFVRDDALRIGIEFHSLGAVYEYDLSNKEEPDLGTANAPLTDDRSVQLWVSATGFIKSVIYWGVKLFTALYVKVSKGAKIRNRYNQVPHLTQDTNGKETNSQLDTTNESQEVSPFQAGDHKAHINRRSQRHSKHKTEKT